LVIQKSPQCGLFLFYLLFGNFSVVKCTAAAYLIDKFVESFDPAAVTLSCRLATAQHRGECDTKSTVATKRLMRPAIQTKDPREGGLLDRMSKVST
jgi:hypothetical protein